MTIHVNQWEIEILLANEGIKNDLSGKKSFHHTCQWTYKKCLKNKKGGLK